MFVRCHSITYFKQIKSCYISTRWGTYAQASIGFGTRFWWVVVVVDSTELYYNTGGPARETKSEAKNMADFGLC
jgi:hypothetical protein